jgi:hypothetical protein
MKLVKEGRLSDYGLRVCPDWTTGRKAGRQKKGEHIKSGLYNAIPKGKAGTNRTKATKRWRCNVCGKYGHVCGDCFLLEKSEEIEHAGIHALPIEDIVMDDDGREGPL